MTEAPTSITVARSNFPSTSEDASTPAHAPAYCSERKREAVVSPEVSASLMNEAVVTQVIWSMKNADPAARSAAATKSPSCAEAVAKTARTAEAKTHGRDSLNRNVMDRVLVLKHETAMSPTTHTDRKPAQAAT